MKLTITIEEEKESDVRIERTSAGATVAPAEELPSDVAAIDAGGPPEWLLAELEESAETREAASGDALDAGPGPVSTNGVGLLHG
jgi:hypothetical protein